MAVLLPVLAPSGLLGPAPSLSALGGWLRGLLTSPQVKVVPGPRQQSGTAKGARTRVSASETDAGRGVGRPPGKGKGELAAYAPHRPGGKPQPVQGRSGKDGFDPKTSKRVAESSTATQDVYSNADGSYTAKVYAGRVNYETARGRWGPIDTSLVADGNHRYGQKANGTGLTLAATAADPALVSLSADAGRGLSFGLKDAGAAQAVVTGDVATYPQVFPGVDLVESATPTGVKEALILHSAAAGTSWQFPLQLNGLKPRLAKDGSVELADAAGKVVYRIPHGYMHDSAVDATTRLPATSTAVTYTLETAGGSPSLRISVDAKWLHDPTRRFPVTVDPTIQEVVGTSAASGSSYVSSASTSGGGSESLLAVGRTTINDAPRDYRSFVQFGGLETGLAGRQLTSAALRLQVYSADNSMAECARGTGLSVGQITQSWTPGGVTTWPGPAIGGSASSPVAINVGKGSCKGDSSAAWLSLPLDPSLLQTWIDRPESNQGLGLWDPTMSAWMLFEGAAATAPDAQPSLTVTYVNVPPQVDVQSPPDNVNVSTLTPQLSASAHDPDVVPKEVLQYQFTVYDDATAGNVVAQSGLQADGNWVVPAGKLVWGKTYFWAVQAFDGVSYSSSTPRRYALSTLAMQAPAASGLSQKTDGSVGDPASGNYTTAATDAVVATVGPALSVQRNYNSLDTRVTTAFGTGWSSVFDANVTEARDATGTVQAVVATYPDGQQVVFGRNADGSFAPPLGRYATLAPLSGGGYAVTDKNATVYVFAQGLGGGTYGITSVADAQQRTERLTYNGSGQVVQVAAASGRHLILSWSTPSGARAGHVDTVSTDAAVPWDTATVSTWHYRYDGDRLTSVCPPTSATKCTTYGYGDASPYPVAVANAGPTSYWRLGEPAGATVAASSVTVNMGTDNASYHGVALGRPGSLTGSSATAAEFNGSSSWLTLPSLPGVGGPSETISMRFKTTGKNEVLFSYQADPIENGTTPGNYIPALYIGDDGKLLGTFWNCPTGVSASAVNDGHWHEVALSAAGNTQSLYLDGVKVGAKTCSITPINAASTGHVYVGNGFLGGSWMDQTRSSGAGVASAFTGSISDVAFFDRPLSDATVAKMAAAGAGGTGLLTSVTRPSGAVGAQVAYDPVTARVTQVTDQDGAVWNQGAPTTGGSSRGYVSAVLGAGPRDYWRFAEDSATDAVNHVPGDRLRYVGGVTLNNSGGPFPDATVAKFDGTSGYADAASPVVVDGGNQSVSLWFSTTMTKAGVLAAYEDAPLDNVAGGYGYVPMLYLGNDGKLRGQYWDGSAAPITTAGAVNDGVWHHVVLAAGTDSQSMFLDGKLVGTKTGRPGFYGMALGAHTEIAAGFLDSAWAGATATARTATYFNGSIAEVAFYRSQLSTDQVTQQYAAAQAAMAPVSLSDADGRPITVPVSVVKVTGPQKVTTTYVSDVSHGNRLLAKIDALGQATKYGYDTAGFQNLVTDANGHTVTTGHDVRGNTVSKVTCQDRSKNQCSTTYSTYFPDDTSATLTPDPRNDQLLTVRDPRSASASDNRFLTSYTYDAHGNSTAVTTPPVSTDGSSITATRTTSTTYTDTTTPAAGGGTTPAGLPASVTTPGGAVTRYEYYPAGDLAKVTDPVGLVTQYTYDGLGRILTKKVTSDRYPNGLTTTYGYDLAGRMVSQTDPSVSDPVDSAKKHSTTTTWTFDDDGLTTSRKTEDTTGGDAPRTVSTTYDPHSRVATSTDPTGAVTRFDYDPVGNVASRTDPSGTVTRYEYDADQRLTKTILTGYTGSDPANSSPSHDLVQSARAYDPAGRLASITDAMGRVTAYTYTGDGLLASVTRRDPDSSPAGTFVVQANTYDAAGNVISRTTNNGATTTQIVVDAANRTVSSTVDPQGLERTTSYAYTADDQVSTARLADGSGQWSSTAATYDLAGRAASQTLTGSADPHTSRTTAWSLDQRGLPKSETDPAGNVSDFTYDEAGQLVKQQEPSVMAETISNGTAIAASVRPTTTTQYNGFGEITAVTDPNGNTTSYGYDDAGRPTAQTLPAYTPPGAKDAITATGRQTYDALGQITSRTDLLGNTTSYAYDQLGDLTKVTDPNGETTLTAYDPAQEPLSVTDPTGAVTEATYDFLGRKITSTQRVRSSPATDLTISNPYTTTYGYDPLSGWLHKVSTPAGVTTTTNYNAAGEPTSVVDGAGNTTRYAYDHAGRKTSTTLPDGTRLEVSYDDAGNPLAQTDLDAAGKPVRTVSAGYDLNGNQTSATDARGNTTTFTYDANGAVTRQTQPVDANTSITTTFGYDAAGQRVRFSNGLADVPNGRGYDWLATYNAWGLPESQIEPATKAYSRLTDRTFTTSYDANGNPTRVDQPGGVSVTNTYDKVGNLTTSSGSGAKAITTPRSFGYDAAGRLTSAATGTGTNAATNTFTYDDRDLLLTATGASGSSTFSYTPDGLMASRADTDGTTSYTYDGAGRLATLADPLTDTTSTYTYNDLSLPTRIAYGADRNTRSFGYDSLHRLTSDGVTAPDGTTVTSIKYRYDLDDNLTSKATAGVGAKTTNTYTYDAANRLSSWDNGTTTTGYTYDNAGNLTRAGTTTYRYDERNQLLQDGTASYGYTANGSLSNIYGPAGGTVTSDAFGQVVSQGGNKFTYDAFGRVTAMSKAPGPLTYSGLSNTLAGDGTASYSHTPDDALVGIKDATGTSRLALTDRHDDVVAQLDAASGAVAATTTYDPFGKVTATTGDSVGRLGYQSGWTDPGTGRVNMWSRWYDPAQSRFISRDELDLSPVPEPFAANRYAYLNDNPFSGIDPLGTCNIFSRSCWESGWKSFTSGVTGAANTVASGVTGAANTVASGVTGAANTVGHAVADGYEAAKQGVVTAAQTTATFMKEHAGTIVSIAVGVLVGAACNAVVTAATAGAGSLAGAVACGMLTGAVAGAVEHAVDAAVGNTEFSWKDMGLSMAIGAAAGVAGELVVLR
ncbi:MAG TPA: LamG-like jellyroll fold domain-containing protein [Kineosporiaceae bacterium]|nr:LamG-like jellyroll fold domain-containing protein [Kineosporiaceae bacterium]